MYILLKSLLISPLTLTPVKLMTEVAYLICFTSQSVHVILLKEKLGPFHKREGLKTNRGKEWGPELTFLSLITSKLGFNLCKLLGFCNKSTSKSAMFWQLRRNVSCFSSKSVT